MDIKQIESKYVIHMNDSADWLRHYDEGTQVVNDFILPVGPHQKDEMSDTIYHKDATVPYHQHRRGVETFYIAAGSVECFIRGRRFIALTGDMIHLPPHTPHGFHFLEEGTIWRELFQEIDMSQGILEKNTVMQNYPELLKDDEFLVVYRGGRNELRREPPVCETVDRTEMHELRTPEFAFSEYHGDGFDLKLKVGKWETGGVKEVWHASLKQGLKVSFDYPHPHYELYYVTGGRIKLTVLGEEFIAEKDTLIRIPPFRKHSFEVLEDATLFDYGGETDLMALLEDYKSVMTNDPARLNDPTAHTAFLRKYGCFATGIEYSRG